MLIHEFSKPSPFHQYKICLLTLWSICVFWVCKFILPKKPYLPNNLFRHTRVFFSSTTMKCNKKMWVNFIPTNIIPVKQKHIQCLECICFQMRIHLVSVQMLQNDHQMTLLRYLLNISKIETNLCEVCVVLQRNWFCWKANLPRHWLETLDQIETAQRHMRQIQSLETFKITSTNINVKKITNTWFSHL